MLYQLHKSPAKRMALAGSEVGERHTERAAGMRFELMHLACEAVGRQPLGLRVGIQEGTVEFLGRGPHHAMEFYSVGHLSCGPLALVSLTRNQPLNHNRTKTEGIDKARLKS